MAAYGFWHAEFATCLDDVDAETEERCGRVAERDRPYRVWGATVGMFVDEAEAERSAAAAAQEHAWPVLLHQVSLGKRCRRRTKTVLPKEWSE